MNHMIRGALLASCAIVPAAVMPVTSAYAQSASRNYSIAPQPMNDALRQYANQSGQDVVFDPALVAGLKSKGLQGSYDAEMALKAVVRGTKLEVYKTSSGFALRGNGSVAITASDGDVAASSGEDETTQDIVVTGTSIRGAAPAGSNVIVLDKKYIERTGYSTVQDVIKSIPQAAPAPGGDVQSLTGVATGNFGYGAGIDLRGAGLGTTLVLVNGLRQASAGTLGRFTDISTIPLAAVDHIEILLDGASAIYGSDAIGGVVNIVLRKDLNGAETNVRYDHLRGGGDLLTLSQTFGLSWGSGNVSFGGQFQKRKALPASARNYAADSDQRSNGGDNFSSTTSNPGNILCFQFDGSCQLFEPVFAIPRGQDGTALTPEQLITGQPNLQNLNERYNIVPKDESRSAFVTLSQDINSNFDVNAEIRYTYRPVVAKNFGLGSALFVPPSNAFYFDAFGDGAGFYVLYDLSQDLPIDLKGATRNYSAAASARWKVGRDWQVRLLSNYSRNKLEYKSATYDFAKLSEALASSDPATAFNPLGDGSNTNPAVLKDILAETRESAVSYTWQTTLSGDGTLVRLPSGPVKVALGIDFRRDAMPDTGSGPARTGHLRRDITSVFGEAKIPVFRRANAPFLTSLDLAIAGRYDHYSDFGDTFNPRIGADLRLTPSLIVKGNWNTAFRAPTLSQLETSVFNRSQYALRFLSDPQSASGFSPVLLQFGVNPDLKEETAHTWSIGAVWTPEKIAGLRIAATYNSISFKGRIAQGGTPGRQDFILREENIWSDLIGRNPTATQISDICNSPDFLGLPISCAMTPPVAIVDLRFRNLALTRIRSMDFELGYRGPAWNGTWRLDVAASKEFSNIRAVSKDSPKLDIVNTFGNPLSFRARAQAGWSNESVDAHVTANYTNAYRDFPDNSAIVSRRIDDLVTFDLGVSYRIRNTGFFKGITARASIVNIFDASPPYTNSQYGYDQANFDPYGRVIGVQLIKSW